MNEFLLSIRQFEKGIIIDMSGELGKPATDTVLTLNIWGDKPDSDKENIVLNFTNVSYVNSAGVSILIRAIKPALQNGYNIFAFGVTSLQEKLFRAVGLTELMMLYPDEYATMQRINNIKK